MPAKNDYSAVCSQLLRPEDLQVDEAIFEALKEQQIVTRIVSEQASIHIYSVKHLYLSDIMPVLHNFGFRIVDEVTYRVEKEKTEVFITRFNLQLEDSVKINRARDNIERVISDSLCGRIQSKCLLFSMVYQQNISIREVELLRGVLEYVDQAVLEVNYGSILQTMTTYHEIARLFIDYFLTKFTPECGKRENRLKDIEGKIEEKIKAVPNIMDDKILKITFSLFKNLLRTNYFLGREAISLKIDTATFSENLKGLQPNIEAFVYHPEFSGVHLRMSRISRGGLRWSERHEDYRQEIKSLMITQEGKNSIIIPDGAKGGFVIRKDRNEIDKAYFQTVYSQFIESLIDLVDNRVDNKIVRNEQIIAYDGDDDYFVVAADKGTAAMSDVANSIAIERGYWLGDAFASGGSKGFGHKELGITARGSLMSTKRFFIEKGVDFYKDPVTIVGIGSMNGDVFGNGLLESEAFKLLAAVGHKDIFIDPDPDPATSYAERKRLFESKNGGWSQYNESLISQGGGIFSRRDKAIELSPEIKKMVGT
ncbi:MAG: NAD-glutamate dehydrogenase, partial [Sulfurimonadaceae bacterium]|nr:NAD-glutamate dehydrogenase [Sulfurimonadaceae bacterium]